MSGLGAAEVSGARSIGAFAAGGDPQLMEAIGTAQVRLDCHSAEIKPEVEGNSPSFIRKTGRAASRSATSRACTFSGTQDHQPLWEACLGAPCRVLLKEDTVIAPAGCVTALDQQQALPGCVSVATPRSAFVS